MRPTTDTTPALPPRGALLLLFGVLLAVIVWALPRHVQPGDAGEFATIMLRGGVPHPPGYPWMRLLGGAARLGEVLGLPAASAAALPCALLGAVGWTWLARSTAQLCAWPIALGTMAFVACSHVVVLHGCDSEVWGPLVFAVAGLVHLALAQRRPAWQIGMAFGAALGLHLTVVWLLPLVVYAAWPKPAGRRGLVTAAATGALGTAGGLMIFATLVVGDPEAAWRWGQLDTVAGLLRHVGRNDYGTFSLSLHDASPDALAQLGRAATSWDRVWSAGLVEHPAWALPMIACVGVGARAAWPAASAGLGLALATSWLLAAVGFPLLHDIDPRSPFGAWILERFDLMPLALSAIAGAVALSAAARTLRPGWPVVLARITAVAVGAQQIGTTASLGVPADDDAIEVYARDVLRTPDPTQRAIVLGTDDHRSFAVLFAQTVLGEGAQVVYIDASLLAHPWYRAALRRRMPELPDEDKPVRLLMSLWSRPEHRTIAVYLANDFSMPSSSLPRVPEGVLWRVLGPDDLGVSPDDVVARHLQAMGRLVGPPRGAHTPFAMDVAAAWPEANARLRVALQGAGRHDLVALLPLLESD